MEKVESLLWEILVELRKMTDQNDRALDGQEEILSVQREIMADRRYNSQFQAVINKTAREFEAATLRGEQ